jgi:misacylated tRNA(Ala) deacylase
VYELEANVIDARPGVVLLDRSPVFPGGGGQLLDRALIVSSIGETNVESAIVEEKGTWHVLNQPVILNGKVLVKVDRDFREMMCELHTAAHVVNAIVFMEFDGALLTGAQLGGDYSFRLDFDLPEVENDRLRALEGPINEAIRQDFVVRAGYMPWDNASAEKGIFRSKAVAPPKQDDDTIRIVEIVGLDRQACGGTHVRSTAECGAAKILKTENKGRHNRRVRIGLLKAQT